SPGTVCGSRLQPRHKAGNSVVALATELPDFKLPQMFVSLARSQGLKALLFPASLSDLRFLRQREKVRPTNLPECFGLARRCHQRVSTRGTIGLIIPASRRRATERYAGTQCRRFFPSGAVRDPKCREPCFPRACGEPGRRSRRRE